MPKKIKETPERKEDDIDIDSLRKTAECEGATRTPLKNYNKEMEKLNKLLKEGHINQETFGRATEQAQEKLKKSADKVGDVIGDKFGDLGKIMEGTIAYSLDGINVAASTVSAILLRASSLT